MLQNFGLGVARTAAESVCLGRLMTLDMPVTCAFPCVVEKMMLQEPFQIVAGSWPTCLTETSGHILLAVKYRILCLNCDSSDDCNASCPPCNKVVVQVGA